MAYYHHDAQVAGPAVPEMATSDHSGLSQLATAGAASFGLRHSNKDDALDTVRAGRANQASTENPDFAEGRTEGKTFATLRALLALAGHALSRASAEDGPCRYHVSRWGHVRELRDIDAVLAFALHVGAAS